MAKINPIEITNGISAAIRIGGTVLSVNNHPNMGAGLAIFGELLPLIAPRINKLRQDIFIRSIYSNLDNDLSQVNYSDKPEVYDQILNTARKAMLSESDYTIFLMGKITASVIKESRRYTQNELQLIDALYRMNDYDFVNFIIVCNQIGELGKKSGNEVLVDEVDLHGEADSSKDNVVFSLKKLNGLNLFDHRATAIFGDEQTYCSSDFYSMNSLTKDLLELIESVERTR